MLIVFALGCLLGVAVGYFVRGWQQPSVQRVTLATVLRKRGITPQSISHLRFVGDENSYTTSRVASETNAVEWI